LARTITLVESNFGAHQAKAQAVLKHLLPQTGKSIRVGITGAPGVGKSSFIETLGCHLVEQGRQVAVLAIDPSSSITKGSILGDKTRMERLSQEPGCFIRPSPSGGTLGGVARKSRETMLVCEAAGFDIVLIETIGVGQNEFMVRSMVDFFLLLVIPGAGDELQGIKRGVMELADAILVNKADGDNTVRAMAAKAEYDRAIHYLTPATKGWQTTVHTCSSMTGEGVAEIWGVIEAFRGQAQSSGEFTKRRKGQGLDWVHMMIEEHLRSGFFGHPNVKKALPAIEKAVEGGEMPATEAVDRLLELFETTES
jgi:LAO/AO transport system kinase